MVCLGIYIVISLFILSAKGVNDFVSFLNYLGSVACGVGERGGLRVVKTFFVILTLSMFKKVEEQIQKAIKRYLRK